jgi:hypothetical protein
VSAASAENELTAMTIDSVNWSTGDKFMSQVFGGSPGLLCHVAEWRGYGKMLRFTRKSDPVFFLEADGHPSIEATMLTGGVCNSEGTTRSVMLKIGGTLDPTARYRLRARNENKEYRWAMPADLVVAAPEAKR